MTLNLNPLEIFGNPQTVIPKEPSAPSSQITNNILKQAERKALEQLTPDLAQLAQVVFTDPGFDISPKDSELWLRLFSRARSLSFEFHAKLFYVRANGAILVPSKKFGYMIKALIDPEGKKGWISREVYEKEKLCLNPYKNDLVKLLRELRTGKREIF